MTTSNCWRIIAGLTIPPRPQRLSPDSARFVFFTGLENRCFLPESQVRTFKWFESREPGRHAIHELRGYSHLDVFMGKSAARDVFPLMLAELEGSTATATVGAAT